MMRVAVCLVALVALLGALAVPGVALAAGCEVLADRADRAECVARAQARAAAQAEVERRVDGPPADDEPRSAAWQQALDESTGFDADALLEPRVLAAVGGLAWFALVVRARLRARRRPRT